MAPARDHHAGWMLSEGPAATAAKAFANHGMRRCAAKWCIRSPEEHGCRSTLNVGPGRVSVRESRGPPASALVHDGTLARWQCWLGTRQRASARVGWETPWQRPAGRPRRRDTATVSLTACLLVLYSNNRRRPPCPPRPTPQPSSNAVKSCSRESPHWATCGRDPWCRTTAAAAGPTVSVPTSSTPVTGPTGCSPAPSRARPAASPSRPRRSRRPKLRSQNAGACGVWWRN